MSDDLQLKIRVHADPAWAADEMQRLQGQLCETRAHLVTEMNLGTELRGILAQYLAENERLRANVAMLVGRVAWLDATKEELADTQRVLAQREAEVERLKRERSEWCDQADRRLTEQMTQQRDLLAENAALRARLTLTPERVEAAAKAQYEFDNPGGPEFKDCMARCLYLGASRAALLAAGMEEEQ